ncbi:Ppx/GppA family phosphatase [Halalkalibacter urbisdiaboli]|uniref:Ppx/GppA family phosphatase n=1 Tax=Halalkalibacter urbisdiaboli TaxID=1960589 RepID=UPI001FDA2F7A|nr:Ppx/GppA family phosphatase [Halalkalibacter urbisdiaboli]
MFLKENVVALIDMGSNSIQLAMYQIDHIGRYHEMKRMKVSARLISYLNKQGTLTKDGVRVIINTLKRFEKVTRSYNVNHIIGFATAVIRNSSNQAEVLDEIERQTDISFTVLSEYEEAYYGYLGVIQSMDIEDGITIDIGGGSTEITLFQKQKLVHYHSFPFGAVTLNQQFTNGEQVSNKQITHLRTYLFEQFLSLPWLKTAKCPIVGIGGSARNLARIHETKSKTKQPELKLKKIEKIFDELSSLDVSKRSKIKGLSKRRKDIIIPAVQTFTVLMEVVQSPYFIYCDKTVRDGVIYETFVQKSNKQPLQIHTLV